MWLFIDRGLFYASTRTVPCRTVPCRAVPYRAVPCRVVPEEIWFDIVTATGTSRFYKIVLAVALFEAEPQNARVIQYFTPKNS